MKVGLCAQIFNDKSVTIEDILRDKGEGFKRGAISADGDYEFWEDGSMTERQKPAESSKVVQ